MSQQEGTGTPIHVDSADHLESVVQEHDVVLVDFHADWCGPCQMLEPTVESLASDDDLVVAKVDIDELQQFAADAGVRSVPTLQFYANGEPAERLVGVQDEETLRDVAASLD